MTAHVVAIISEISGTVLGGVILWLLKSGVQAAIRLRDDVHDIKTNHIVHLQKSINELKEAIRDLTAKVH